MPPILCPACRGVLSRGQPSWSCTACRRSYRALRGIPDLRTAEDAFLPNAEDWELAEPLDRVFDRESFRGLLDHYFDLAPPLPPDLRRRQIAHILTAPARSAQWLAAIGADAVPGPLLDLGCGTGSFLAATANARPDLCCGVDIAMRWLIVARKRLDEEGRHDVDLVCGCAEQLPFIERSFARVIAGDVIEHVGDQAATLAESYRVLRPGGRLFLASPNRYSLAPEPHVQVWGVGYLPRRWMSPFVRHLRGVDFKAIRTLGHSEWQDVLAASPFGGGSITCPPLPSTDLDHFGLVKRTLARAYNAVVRSETGQTFARRIGPLFHVICERPAHALPRPILTTRQRTRRPTARP